MLDLQQMKRERKWEDEITHFLVSNHDPRTRKAFCKIRMLWVCVCVCVSCSEGLHCRPGGVKLTQTMHSSLPSPPLSPPPPALWKEEKRTKELFPNPPLCRLPLSKSLQLKKGQSAAWMTTCLVLVPKEKLTSPLGLHLPHGSPTALHSLFTWSSLGAETRKSITSPRLAGV